MKIFLEKFVLGVPEAKTFKTDKRSSFGVAFKVENLKEGDQVKFLDGNIECELDDEIVDGYLTYSSTATETKEYSVVVERDGKQVQVFPIKNVVVEANEFFKDASGGGLDEVPVATKDKVGGIKATEDKIELDEDGDITFILADEAKQADYALDAAKAGTATNATNATNAEKASLADLATNANHALDSDHATTADLATNATQADYANRVDDQTEGLSDYAKKDYVDGRLQTSVSFEGEYEDGTPFSFETYTYVNPS